MFSIYGPNQLTIQRRAMPIPLEGLDFVIDMQGRRLIGNPAHGGEHMLEMY
jgi:hypothetical protein